MCLGTVCRGDRDSLLFHLPGTLPPSASDGRGCGLLDEGPPFQRYILRNTAGIQSQQKGGRAHTLSYLRPKPSCAGTGSLATRCLASYPPPLQHTPVGGSLKVGTYEAQKQKKNFFFPQRTRLFGAVIFFKGSLLGMSPRKNENQTISLLCLRGSGRGTSLLRLISFSLRVPSASSNCATDSLIPAPPGVTLKTRNQ